LKFSTVPTICADRAWPGTSELPPLGRGGRWGKFDQGVGHAAMVGHAAPSTEHGSPPKQGVYGGAQPMPGRTSDTMAAVTQACSPRCLGPEATTTTYHPSRLQSRASWGRKVCMTNTSHDVWASPAGCEWVGWQGGGWGGSCAQRPTLVSNGPRHSNGLWWAGKKAGHVRQPPGVGPHGQRSTIHTGCR
jgi:hypothetical protein